MTSSGKKYHDMASFWMVSDKVHPEVITGVTKDCENPLGCRISCRVQETTCAGISDHYDKDGRMVVNKGNRFTAYLYCMHCHNGWEVDQNGKILTHHDYKEVIRERQLKSSTH
jgi:hypothetical protein